MFKDLSSCLAALAKIASPAEKVWIDTELLICDAQADFGERTSSIGAPAGHLYRTQLRSGARGRWEQLVPRFLYRGEGRRYPTTWTGIRRMMMDDESLSASDKRDLCQVRAFVERVLHGGGSDERWMSMAFAEAISQHYGLPANFVDFTSSLDVTRYFASPTPGGGGGAVAVFDLARFNETQCGHYDFGTIDLTAHPWAQRPMNQQAYGVQAFGAWIDLKDSSLAEELGITWYEFDQSLQDRTTGGTETQNLLDASTDVIAGFVLLAVDEFERTERVLSAACAKWIASKLPHVRLAIRLPQEGEKDSPQTVTWLEAGFSHSEEQERATSEKLWCGAVSKREPPA